MPTSAERVLALRAQLGGPRDGVLLRHALGTALLESGDAHGAIESLRTALVFDDTFSAAWKLLGNAHLAIGDADAAAAAWRHGITAADARGDVQAAKEMRVFLKRAEQGSG